MSSRARQRSFVSIALVILALAGCPQHELPPPVVVAAPDSASSEELRWVIEAALAAHNWTVDQRGPGTMRASVHSQGSGENAVIEINYRPGAIDIRCVKQRVSEARYNRWMQVLRSEIMKSAAQLGTGRERPPAPLPPSSVP